MPVVFAAGQAEAQAGAFGAGEPADQDAAPGQRVGEAGRARGRQLDEQGGNPQGVRCGQRREHRGEPLTGGGEAEKLAQRTQHDDIRQGATGQRGDRLVGGRIDERLVDHQMAAAPGKAAGDVDQLVASEAMGVGVVGLAVIEILLAFRKTKRASPRRRPGAERNLWPKVSELQQSTGLLAFGSAGGLRLPTGIDPRSGLPPRNGGLADTVPDYSGRLATELSRLCQTRTVFRGG